MMSDTPGYTNIDSSTTPVVVDSHNLFENVFNKLPVPSIILEESGQLIQANPAFLKLTGRSKGPDVAKINLVDMLPALEKDKLRDLLMKFHSNRHQTAQIDTCLVNQSGVRKSMNIVLKQLSSSGLILATFFDKTELEESFTEIEQKSNDLENLLLLISHNLKSPIVSIQGFTNLLLENQATLPPAELRHYLERIQKNNTRLEKMVHDLLEFAKFNKRDTEFVPVSLDDVLQNIHIEYHLQLKEKNIRLKIPKQMPEVVGDREGLITVFANLVDNAMKYMGDTSQAVIEIGWEEQKRFFVFWVKDNGAGIEESFQEQVFQLFERAGVAKEIEGTGVGLAIVKRIVENQGGCVRMSSQKGKGTTVYFSLPKQA